MAYGDSARLNFLRDSAKSLECQSPSTAAHLMSVHTEILYEDGRPLKPRQHEFFCGACGSLRNPGCKKIVRGASNSNRSKMEDKPTKLNRGGKGLRIRHEAIVYTCLQCHRRRIQPLEQPTRQHSSLKQSVDPTSTSTASPLSQSSTSLTSQIWPSDRDRILTDNIPTKTMGENSSSKKRAKARKQGGLQDLLASKRAQAPPTSSSLDLLDFLQQ